MLPNNKENLAEESAVAGRSVTPREPMDSLVMRQAIKVDLDSSTATYRPSAPSDPEIWANSPILPLKFGDYLIRCEVGRGGMGIVYKAFHQGLNRVVALKCLRLGELASSREIQRFRAEAQAAARLDHPNIVPVFEVGIYGTVHFYAMGFVDGETLSFKLQKGPWLPRDSVALTETLARALAYAHQRGVIHRDLKPSNILIDVSGQPRIADFGLAKLAEANSDITLTGDVLGTPKYAPPEQLAGRTNDISFASDTYSLGAILYCLLTGRPPFEAATTPETIHQVLHDEPVPPRRLNPVVPKDLETICLKCLEKSPPRRYATATELAVDLRRYLDGKPIVARPVRLLERSFRWCVRNPIVASLMALVVLVTGIGASVSVSFAVQLSNKAHEAANNLEDANEATVRLKTEQDRSNQILYQSQIQQAYWEWKLGNTRRLSELLDVCSAKYRGWEHQFLSEIPRRGHQTWPGHTASVLCLAVSPDGRQLASGSRDRTVRLWDIATGRQLQNLGEHRADVTCVAFSRNGRWLLSGSIDRTVRVWDMQTRTQRRVLRSLADGVKSLAITPAGDKLVIATDDGVVKVVQFGTFEEQHILQPAGLKVVSVDISPDGKLVTAAFKHAAVRVWKIDSGAEVLTLPEQGGSVNCVVFDPSGKWLARSGQDGVIRIWNVAAGTEQHALQWHTNAVTTLAFSSDSQRLVSGGVDHLICEWEVASGVLLRTLRGHNHVVNCVVLPDDSRQIISGSEDATLRIWEPDVEQESLVATGHEAWIDLAAFNPDQTLIATTSSSTDHSVRIWDVATGRLVRMCQELVDRAEVLAFTRDGRHLRCIDGLGQLQTFDVATGQRIGICAAVVGCGAAALSSSQEFFVTAGTQKIIRLWKSDDGAQITELLGHTDEIQCLAIDPNEKWIASGSRDKTVRIWDLAERRERHVLHGHTKRPRSVAFDATGTRLVTAGDDATVRVWDVESGQQLLEMHGHGAYVRSAAFSPDGRRIVSGSLDTHIKLWDAHTGDEILTLRGHRDAVLFVAFSPDGRRIASGSSDKTLRLWDAGSSSR